MESSKFESVVIHEQMNKIFVEPAHGVIVCRETKCVAAQFGAQIGGAQVEGDVNGLVWHNVARRGKVKELAHHPPVKVAHRLLQVVKHSLFVYLQVRILWYKQVGQGGSVWNGGVVEHGQALGTHPLPEERHVLWRDAATNAVDVEVGSLDQQILCHGKQLLSEFPANN